MEDKQIISLFNARSERAISETQLKYGRLLRKIAGNILKNDSDAQECENDVYLALWERIPPESPNPFISFACRIARNIALKRYAHNSARKRNSYYDVCLDEIGECLTSGDTTEATAESRETVRLIEGFLDSLSPENRFLFMSRYWFADSYKEISARSGLSEKNVSVRLTRIRKELKRYLEEKEVAI